MKAIGYWLWGLFRAWRREFRLIWDNKGALIFFLALPTLYPVVYTLIYNPEVAVEIPVVAVDSDGTRAARDFLRTVNQTQTIDIVGYAASLDEAKEAMHEKACYGIIEVPAGFAKHLGRGEQAVVPFYTEMSLLIRLRQFEMALTDIQIATGQKMAAQKLEDAGMLGDMAATLEAQVNTEAFFLGDPTQGFASFIMPGILILIIQQSIVLGLTMLAGAAAERRRRNGGYDPLAVDAPASAQVIAKALAIIVLYLPLVFYAIHLVPWMFNLPHYGSLVDAMLFLLPLVLASAMFAQTLGVFVTEREASFMVIVFTSVVFLFLSGLTWPRYAMSPFWHTLGDLVPATWGLEGFVRINSLDATLAEQRHPYLMLWLLTALYGVLAYLVARWYRRRNRRLAPKA